MGRIVDSGRYIGRIRLQSIGTNPYLTLRSNGGFELAGVMATALSVDMAVHPTFSEVYRGNVTTITLAYRGFNAESARSAARRPTDKSPPLWLLRRGHHNPLSFCTARCPVSIGARIDCDGAMCPVQVFVRLLEDGRLLEQPQFVVLRIDAEFAKLLFGW